MTQLRHFPWQQTSSSRPQESSHSRSSSSFDDTSHDSTNPWKNGSPHRLCRRPTVWNHQHVRLEEEQDLMLHNYTVNDDNATDVENHNINSSWHEEAHWMSFRHAVQNFALVHNRKDNNNNNSALLLLPSSREVDHWESDDNNYMNNNNRRLRPSSNHEAAAAKWDLSPSSSSTSPSMESDLAETKMRLALAQAERDELEFALLLQQQQQQLQSPLGR